MPGNENTPTPANKAMDIDVVFLLDATESQQPYIDAILKHIPDAVPEIKNQADLKGGTARFRITAFGDHPEQDHDFLVWQRDFTDNAGKLADDLDKLRKIGAKGGGDGPEAQIDGLDIARRSSFRGTAKKIVILVTDSPPHGVGEPGDSVPASHPGALTDKKILNTYKKFDIHINVLACTPEITYYDTAVDFYKNLCKEAAGLYVPIPEPHLDADAIKNAIVGCVLYSTGSLRTAERWSKWIMDQSHRGQNAITTDIYSKLVQEGVKCHSVSCTEHRGQPKVQYAQEHISRDHVDAIVHKTLQYQADIKANPHMYDEY